MEFDLNIPERKEGPQVEISKLQAIVIFRNASGLTLVQCKEMMDKNFPTGQEPFYKDIVPANAFGKFLAAYFELQARNH